MYGGCIGSLRSGDTQSSRWVRARTMQGRPAFRFHVRLDAASYLNVFNVNGRTRRRTYGFFSVALAVLRRVAFVATVGFDALAGSADCAGRADHNW
jgi:hypothetical protein